MHMRLVDVTVRLVVETTDGEREPVVLSLDVDESSEGFAERVRDRIVEELSDR